MPMNPDLADERLNASFDVQAMSMELYGEDAYHRRREIKAFVASKPEFNDPIPTVYMDREERVDNAARKSAAMMRHMEEIGIGGFEEGFTYYNAIHNNDPHPLSLHFAMFMPSMQGQATSEQQDEWMPQIYLPSVIGTYAQTEIGHGTNLRALQTEAIYDKNTQEFIMRTPCITATKCWPGNLGKFSNVAVVMAQLVIDGKKLGPHGFIVPLRDPETHQPLPGVEVGDIGPKFGMKSNDNGYLILHDVRIPRKNMLMKNSQVTPDGKYIKPPHSKLGYGTMMFVRSIMVSDQAEFLAKAATIATRYSCVRRQGEITPGAGEVKLLDYETQQHRVLCAMATSFAYLFVGKEMRRLYMASQNESTDVLVNLLPDLHALSSGLKSVVSWDVARSIEQCRQACGGHGYAHYSGIPGLYTIAVGGCTYEGDNLVMLLQVARSLVKAVKDKTTGPNTRYLLNQQKLSQLTGSEHLNAFIGWFEHAARCRIGNAIEALRQSTMDEDLSEQQAWANNGVVLTKAARAHTRIFIMQSFINKVESVTSVPLKVALSNLCRLYVITEIVKREAQFLEAGLSLSSIKQLRTKQRQCLKAVRRDAVPLVDSWDFDDRQLQSCLGRYDGHVYPAILDSFKYSKLNQKEVLDSHVRHTGPLLAEGRAKL